MTNTPITLDRFLDKATRLYTLPAVAIEVLRLTAEPKIDMQALKQCLEHDPAAARVLRVVNSSLYGLTSEVSDLSQVLALLGLQPLKLLVLGFSLADPNFCKLTGKAIDHYWRHTLTKAVAARQLSRTLWHLPGDEPFIAALLQDLGLLVLLQDLGQPYATLIEQAAASGNELVVVEAQSLGFDHTALTASLLERWNFPKTLVASVRGRRSSRCVAHRGPRASVAADRLSGRPVGRPGGR